MKSINTIKILEEEENKKKKERKLNNDETELKAKVYNCIDNFIMPQVKKRIELDNSKYIFYEKTLFELLVQHSDYTEAENNMFDEKERNFLFSNDKKLKNRVSQIYVETIIRMCEADEKIEEYYIKYAKPMLEELHKQNIIVFDTKALDNKTKSATNKIEKLVKKIIKDKGYDSKTYPLFTKVFGNDFIEKNDIIFGDNKEQKEKFCNCIKTYIEDNYNNIDYKSVDSTNFSEMKEFTLD